MCGRYAITLPPEAMRDLFRTLNQVDYPPRYNIAPTEPIVAIWEEGGRRTSRLVRWGFVPNWVKDPREFPLLINARVETMAEKPAFRTALRHNRCIVPATGYYEWQTGPDGRKQPYFVAMADGQPMAFAGLYSTWVGPEGEEVDTAAIVTVPAGEDIGHVHDRMPAILEGESVDAWLDTTRVGPVPARDLAVPAPAGVVAFYPVSARVGSNKNDDPDLIVPVAAQPSLPPARKNKAAGGGGQLDLF